MITKNIAKLIVAVTLTIAMFTGTGVVAEQIGLSLTSVVQACTSAGGGGC